MTYSNARRRGRTGLYRLFDAEADLLYIGIGETPSERLRCHTSMKEWWDRVVRAEVVWLPTRVEAEVAELKAIADEKPRYNVMGTTKHMKQPSELIPLPDTPFVTTHEIAATLHLQPTSLSQIIASHRDFPRSAGKEGLRRIWPTDLVHAWIAKHRPHCLPGDEAQAS